MSEDMDFEDLLRSYISIVAAPFPDRVTDTEPRTPIEEGRQLFHLLMLLGAAIIVIIILVICIIAILSKKSREREEAEERAAAVLAAERMGMGIPSLDPSANQFGMAAGRYAAASESAGENPDDGLTIERKEQNLKRQIKLFAEQNPEIAAQLVRTLIKGDELPSG
jgi:flagellar M-ring protein FliF